MGWRILPGNYERFLTQIDADATSVGYWHVGPNGALCGRFARGFDHADGKTKMVFRLDDAFFADPRNPDPLTVRVTYLDRGDGTWLLGSGEGERRQVRNQATEEWKVATFELEPGQTGADGPVQLSLHYEDGADTIFHLIEVLRR